MGVAEFARVEDRAKALGKLVKEIITEIAGIKNVNVYIDTLEPYPYVIVEADYTDMPEEQREFLHSFEYKFNKILGTLFGKEAPYVEIQITPKLTKGKNHLKID